MAEGSSKGTSAYSPLASPQGINTVELVEGRLLAGEDPSAEIIEKMSRNDVSA